MADKIDHTSSAQRVESTTVSLRASMSSSALRLLLERLAAKLEPTRSDDTSKGFNPNRPVSQVA
ncbi:MAG: hypothetical protein AAF267_07490 [Deinococcota bacterium]